MNPAASSVGRNLRAASGNGRAVVSGGVVLALLRALVLARLLLVVGLPVGAEVIREDFATDPALGAWRVHGDAAHFDWNTETGDLVVTWDSRRPNASFYLPLPTVLTRADSFRFRCRLVLDAIATESPESTFQIALGLVRQADAQAADFFRGAGIHPLWGPRNLVEFDYFPASASIAPTLSAIAVASHNTRWATLDLFPFELRPGTPYDLEVRHDAIAARLHLAVGEAGTPLAQGSVALSAGFGDFRLDAFAVTSYSGDHQPAGYGGQVLALGRIDDLEIEFPSPPRVRLEARRVGNDILVALPTVTGWIPILERRRETSDWIPLDEPPAPSEGGWEFRDSASPHAAALYRIRWERP